MKFLKKFTPLAIVMIVCLTSCEIKEAHEDYTQDFTVRQGDWRIGTDDESGDYFYREFKEPNLTQRIYDRGIMQAFLVMSGGVLSPLPFDDFWFIDAFGGYDRTEQVTVEFSPGYVRFILKYSDHEVRHDAPYYEYNFRVRFVW